MPLEDGKLLDGNPLDEIAIGPTGKALLGKPVEVVQVVVFGYDADEASMGPTGKADEIGLATGVTTGVLAVIVTEVPMAPAADEEGIAVTVVGTKTVCVTTIVALTVRVAQMVTGTVIVEYWVEVPETPIALTTTDEIAALTVGRVFVTAYDSVTTYVAGIVSVESHVIGIVIVAPTGTEVVAMVVFG